MKISFDFDRTLANIRIQRLAKLFIKDGHDVYITTSRDENSPHYDNDDLYLVASKVGIPKENIRFTGGEDKSYHLNDFDVHFDDDHIEVLMLEKNMSKCIGIVVD